MVQELRTSEKVAVPFWVSGVAAITKHGKHGTREYSMWCGMKRRCKDPNRGDFKHYGGRGIAVCERWEKDFRHFWEDMKCPAPAGMSIERIDNSKGYGPDNCRWATRAEQGRNQRSNVMLTHEGKTQIATDWAKELGIPWQTIFSRIARGMPVDKVLTVGKFWKGRYGEGFLRS